MTEPQFQEAFQALTGHLPFPWQCALWSRITSDAEDAWPTVVDVPTGLGKTSVIAIWLLARLATPCALPRRLVYVVNRRTVVDQTTAEVERIRERLSSLPIDEVPTLAVSTLRGQFADNNAWSADPSQLAVVCGTVDMIGSRLLFGGYRIGFKSHPLHAGLLGQDTLLIHDEAHLEPAFQALIQRIQEEQEFSERTGDLPWPKLRIMALSATQRGCAEQGVLTLTKREVQVPESLPSTPKEAVHHVWRRLKAPKRLAFHKYADSDPANEVAKLALAHKEKGTAVLIFLRKIEDLIKVSKELHQAACAFATLTGTMRGYERDRQVEEDAIFRRFLSKPSETGAAPAQGTVYLVCTSAGEVGVDLDADHMVCDLTTYDSMAQRLGRVNRRGQRDDTRVDIVHPADFKTSDKKLGELDKRREATLQLLRSLPNHDACPLHLQSLSADSRAAAFAPEPAIPPVSDILFDNWSMTSIRGEMPGRPPLAPYLRGIAEWEPPRTSVGWREEVAVVGSELMAREGAGYPAALLEDYPLKPHELLSDSTERVFNELQKLQEKGAHEGTLPVWLVDERGLVEVSCLAKIAPPSAAKKDEKAPYVSRLEGKTVLLPPKAGGLRKGLLEGDPSEAEGAYDVAYDVADRWREESGEVWRCRCWDEAQPPKGMALIRTIDTDPEREETNIDEESDGEMESGNGHTRSGRRFWHWYLRPSDAENVTPASLQPVPLADHVNAVVERARQITDDLGLPGELREAVVLAAELHDLGKRRELWQRSIGNPNPTDWYAKPGKPLGAPRWRSRHITRYRHEFGSLLDVLNPSEPHRKRLEALSPEMQDVVLHLIAAHHGRARPHFTSDEMADPLYPQDTADEAGLEVMRRYARLQRRYGRWGLAYLESLLRAADWAASAEVASGHPPEEAEAHA